MKTRKHNHILSQIKVREIEVPLKIYIERRNNIRISLGKDNILLRVPIFSADNIQNHIKTAIEWLSEMSKTQPDLLYKYQIAKYELNRELVIFGRDKYKVILHDNNYDDKCKIRHEDGVLTLMIPTSIDPFNKRNISRDLISKLLIKKYRKFVEERLSYWNTKYFNKEIKGITLRYNASNWGSCSTTGRINISTRSLLLPLEVFDYILVHELSHMVEMNHSSKFWKVVENVMPDYKNAEKWISENTHKLDF